MSLNSMTEVAMWTGALPQYGNMSWDDKPGVFSLKTTRDQASVLLMQAADGFIAGLSKQQ
jgi:hypothetical protein